MNKLFISALALSATLMCGSCGMPANNATNGANTQSSTAGAGSQAGGLLTNLLLGLLGQNTQLSPEALAGTWNYQSPKCVFESENFLMKAGGQVAATQVENKLAETFSKVGIKAGVSSFTFDKEGNYTMVMGGRSINGTYTVDASTNTLKMSALLGLANYTVTAQIAGNNLYLLFDADKLLTLVSGLGSLTKSTTVQSVSSLIGSYDGMKVGFTLVK